VVTEEQRTVGQTDLEQRGLGRTASIRTNRVLPNQRAPDLSAFEKFRFAPKKKRNFFFFFFFCLVPTFVYATTQVLLLLPLPLTHRTTVISEVCAKKL
jgi:hypothetical protein